MKNLQLSIEKKNVCEVCERFFWSFLLQYHLTLWYSERKMFFSDDTP